MGRRWRTSLGISSVLGLAFWAGPFALADQPPPQSDPSQHPLLAVMRWAEEQLPRLERIQDYSANLVTRERAGGHLGDYEYLSVKIRHQPFSVYAQFQGPATARGQEALYVEGQNEGRLWGHRPGHILGTMSIQPDSPIAMRGRRYPMTEIGMVNLVRRLLEVGQEDLKHDECEVRFFTGAKINQYVCTCIQVTHPNPRRYFRFHIARIFVDEQLQLPIRYESYSWPTEPGGAPELLEEYTYLNVKLNNGFTDRDFSIDNPAYQFAPVRTQVGAK